MLNFSCDIVYNSKNMLWLVKCFVTNNQNAISQFEFEESWWLGRATMDFKARFAINWSRFLITHHLRAIEYTVKTELLFLSTDVVFGDCAYNSAKSAEFVIIFTFQNKQSKHCFTLIRRRLNLSFHFQSGLTQSTRTISWNCLYMHYIENNVCTRVANCLCAQERVILVFIK